MVAERTALALDDHGAERAAEQVGQGTAGNARAGAAGSELGSAATVLTRRLLRPGVTVRRPRGRGKMAAEDVS